MNPDSKQTSVTDLLPSANNSQDLLIRRRFTNSMKHRPVACLNTRLKYVGFMPKWSATSSSGNSRA
ncbi:hypothetical protein D3C86_2090030 [compost metagenome]